MIALARREFRALRHIVQFILNSGPSTVVFLLDNLRLICRRAYPGGAVVVCLGENVRSQNV